MVVGTTNQLCAPSSTRLKEIRAKMAIDVKRI
jgi:hypothetical protein